MKPKKFHSRENVIYLLPNLFTMINLFFGFYAIISALQDFYLRSAVAILIAGIFDILDGRIARLTQGLSKFGKELDSLSDLISFGLAPAILMYLWSLESFGRIGWLICFVFIACGALRLARFNIKTSPAEKKYFEGLPIPMAAYAMIATTFLYHELMLDEYRSIFNLFMTVILAFLMVSNIHYRSFKDFDLKGRRSFGILVLIVLIMMVVAYNPGVMTFVVMMIYLVSGPLIHLFHRKKIFSGKRKTEDTPNLRLVDKQDPS